MIPNLPEIKKSEEAATSTLSIILQLLHFTWAYSYCHVHVTHSSSGDNNIVLPVSHGPMIFVTEM